MTLFVPFDFRLRRCIKPQKNEHYPSNTKLIPVIVEFSIYLVDLNLSLAMEKVSLLVLLQEHGSELWIKAGECFKCDVTQKYGLRSLSR